MEVEPEYVPISRLPIASSTMINHFSEFSRRSAQVREKSDLHLVTVKVWYDIFTSRCDSF